MGTQAPRTPSPRRLAQATRARWRGRAQSGPPQPSPTHATASRLLPSVPLDAGRPGPSGRRGYPPPTSSLVRCWCTLSVGWDAGGKGAAAGCDVVRAVPSPQRADRERQALAAASAACVCPEPGCSNKITLFPFYWIKHLKLYLPFTAPQDGTGERRHSLPLPPGAAAVSRGGVCGVARAPAGGWYEWTPTVSAEGTRGSGAGLGAASPTAGRRAPRWQGFPTATEGRPARRELDPGAPATTPMPPGAEGPSRPSAIWCLKETHPYVRVK